jgi:hypothetical protein
MSGWARLPRRARQLPRRRPAAHHRHSDPYRRARTCSSWRPSPTSWPASAPTKTSCSRSGIAMCSRTPCSRRCAARCTSACRRPAISWRRRATRCGHGGCRRARPSAPPGAPTMRRPRSGSRRTAPRLPPVAPVRAVPRGGRRPQAPLTRARRAQLSSEETRPSPALPFRKGGPLVRRRTEQLP